MGHPLPSAGRIVHIVIKGKDGQPAVRPAMVVDDADALKGRLGLKVSLKGDGSDSHMKSDYFAGVPYNPRGEVGSWHWPPKVEGEMELEGDDAGEAPAAEDKPKGKEQAPPAGDTAEGGQGGEGGQEPATTGGN